MVKLSDLIKENDSKAENKQIGLAEHFNRLSKDLEKAKEYYQLALQEGYLEAQKELDKLEVEK